MINGTNGWKIVIGLLLAVVVLSIVTTIMLVTFQATQEQVTPLTTLTATLVGIIVGAHSISIRPGGS